MREGSRGTTLRADSFDGTESRCGVAQAERPYKKMTDNSELIAGNETIDTFEGDDGIIFSFNETRKMDKTAMFVYSIEGFFVMIFNIFMFARIMTVRELRQQKEFVLMAACMLFDFLFGLTYFVAGVWRIYIYFKWIYIPAYSQWMCYWSPSVQLFILITPAAGYILVLTALDRFACIFFPLKYIKLSPSYSYIIMFLPYVMDIPTSVISFLDAYNAAPNHNKLMTCMMYDGVSRKLYTYLRWLRIFCSLLVIVLYVPVAIKMYMIVKRQTEQLGISARGQKRLLRLTGTTAMITVNTIIFLIIPDVITSFEINSFVFYIMNMNKGVVNIIALIMTQKPLRRLFYKPSNKIAVSTIDARSMSVAPSKMQVQAIGRRKTDPY